MKPRDELAILVILLMCSSNCIASLRVTPRYMGCWRLVGVFLYPVCSTVMVDGLFRATGIFGVEEHTPSFCPVLQGAKVPLQVNLVLVVCYLFVKQAVNIQL